MRFEWPEGIFLDLTGADNLEDTSPAYSPDGASLAFARKYLDVTRWTPGRQIWLMNSDGSGARPLTQDPYFNHFNMVWDPDGDQIAYVRFDENSTNRPARSLASRLENRILPPVDCWRFFTQMGSCKFIFLIQIVPLTRFELLWKQSGIDKSMGWCRNPFFESHSNHRATLGF